MMLSKIKKQLVQADFEYFIKFKKEIDEKNFDELWQMKLLVRESVREWLIASNIRLNIAENSANACSELVENAIKYSKPDSLIFVSINIIDKKIHIEIFNETLQENKIRLIKTLDRINNYENDLSELYMKRMEESFETDDSQLGLIQIKMETQAQMKLMDSDNPDEEVYFSVIIDLNKMT